MRRILIIEAEQGTSEARRLLHLLGAVYIIPKDTYALNDIVVSFRTPQTVETAAGYELAGVWHDRQVHMDPEKWLWVQALVRQA